MTTVRITGGVLDLETGGSGRPDQGLPGDQPGIDNTLPVPPPGAWPPPTLAHPIVPIPPGTTVPPGTIWPSPGLPPHAGHPLPRPPVRPDNSLPGSQPEVDNELPAPPSGTYWVVCGIPGYGWRYIAVNPSLTVGYPEVPTPK